MERSPLQHPTTRPDSGTGYRLLSGEEAGKPMVRCDLCGAERLYLKLDQFNPPRVTLMPCECVQKRKREEAERYRRTEEQARINRMFSMASVGEQLSAARFDNFEAIEGTEAALRACKDFADRDPRAHSEGLLIYGMPGNGKSRLAASVVNELITQGTPCIFQNVSELFRRIKRTYDDGAGEYETDIIWTLANAPLIVLDDVGAQRVAKKDRADVSWSEEILYSVVDARNRHRKPLIITANAVEAKDLEPIIGARTYDRILEMCRPVKITAPSYRRKLAIERMAREGA